LSDTYKTAKIDFIISWAEDIIRTVYYIHSPWCDEINFCCFVHVCVTQWWALRCYTRAHHRDEKPERDL